MIGGWPTFRWRSLAFVSVTPRKSSFRSMSSPSADTPHRSKGNWPPICSASCVVPWVEQLPGGLRLRDAAGSRWGEGDRREGRAGSLTGGDGAVNADHWPDDVGAI